MRISLRIAVLRIFAFALASIVVSCHHPRTEILLCVESDIPNLAQIEVNVPTMPGAPSDAAQFFYSVYDVDQVAGRAACAPGPGVSATGHTIWHLPGALAVLYPADNGSSQEFSVDVTPS